MNLSNAELLPGVVISSDDPKNIGRVKAIVPTIFEEEDEDKCLWIWPLTMGNGQSFIKPMEGDKIWVLNNKDNYYEFWYFPMFELKPTSRELITTKGTQIFMNKPIADGTANFRYDDVNGFTFEVGKTKLNISPTKGVNFTNGSAGFSSEHPDYNESPDFTDTKATIGIDKSGNLELGKKNDLTFAVRGDKLLEKLTDIADIFEGLLINFDEFKGLPPELIKKITLLKSNLSEIKSHNVNLS